MSHSSRDSVPGGVEDNISPSRSFNEAETSQDDGPDSNMLPDGNQQITVDAAVNNTANLAPPVSTTASAAEEQREKSPTNLKRKRPASDKGDQPPKRLAGEFSPEPQAGDLWQQNNVLDDNEMISDDEGDAHSSTPMVCDFNSKACSIADNGYRCTLRPTQKNRAWTINDPRIILVISRLFLVDSQKLSRRAEATDLDWVLHLRPLSLVR